MAQQGPEDLGQDGLGSNSGSVHLWAEHVTSKPASLTCEQGCITFILFIAQDRIGIEMGHYI